MFKNSTGKLLAYLALPFLLATGCVKEKKTETQTTTTTKAAAAPPSDEIVIGAVFPMTGAIATY